jgi:hypothetical protein
VSIRATIWSAPVWGAACVLCIAPAISAGPLTCGLAHYQAAPGLLAAVADNAVTVTWDGDNHQELRLRLTINAGTPAIQELAVRRQRGAWVTLLSHAAPDFRVVSGLRRITNQQLDPLAGLGVKITQEVVDREKWEAFWDAPLNIPGGGSAHNNTTPPQHGVLNQPGLPRKSCAELRHRNQRRPHRGVVSRRATRGVCRTPPIHGVQGDEPDSPGNHCADVRAFGRLQVRCGY